MYRIREMKPEDARRVAQISIAGWRFAYSNIFPEAFLDELDEEVRTRNWKKGIIENKPDLFRYVFEENGEVMGFICGKNNRDIELVPEADAELWAIYSDPSRIGQGIGGALLDHFCHTLKKNGYKTVLIWSLEANDIGRRFYLKKGAQLIKTTKKFKIESGEFEEVGYLLTI